MFLAVTIEECEGLLKQITLTDCQDINTTGW